MRYDIGSDAGAIVTGDFDEDNDVDAAVAYAYNGGVTVLLGAGDGTFPEISSRSFGYDSDPTGIATGDLNGDSHLDLVVATSGTLSISVLWGNGDGTFSEPVTYPAGKTPNAVTVGDMNGDGLLDVINTNYDSDTFAVLLNGGASCPAE